MSLTAQHRAQLPLEPSPLERLIEHMQAVLPDPPSFGTPVGCSRATGSKHSVYLGVLAWFVKMHGPSIRKGRQFLLGETHAGPAWYLNSATNDLTVGSTLIDLDVLDHHELFLNYPYRAVFCERGKPRKIVDQLRRSVTMGGFGTHGRIDILDGPFEERLPGYLDRLRGPHCGVLFVDGNGSIAHDLIEIFQTYAQTLHFVDVCIWHQAFVRRRYEGVRRNHPDGGNWHAAFEKYDYRPLRELLPDFYKRRWLIRRPFNAGYGTAWTMLVGSNWDKLPEWRAGEMYRLDSPMGQRILAECDG